MIRSARELATRVGKSNVAVSGWLKDARWTFGAGPWAATLVPAMLDWARRTLNPDPAATPGQAAGGRRKLSIGDLDPKQQADVALKLQKLEVEKFKHQQQQGLYHRVDECEQKRVQRVLELKNALLQLPEGLPFPADVRDVVRGRVIELLTRFSQSGR